MKLAIDGGSPVRDSYLVFGRPCIGEEEIAEVVDTLRSRWIGTGPKTFQLEQEFAAWVGAPSAVAVNSCTAGLHLALLVLGVGPGDEVLVPSLTFCATVNVVIHCGATPVFVDVDPDKLTMDPADLARKLTPRTKAVLPVHFGGLAADLDGIRAAAPGCMLVEDAAHAAGTRYHGQMIGGHGNLTAFSFYANKNLTTAEGGMLTVADDALRDRLRVLRLHGMHHDAWKRYTQQGLVHTEVTDAGWKYNLTDLQASIGLHQLRKQEGFLDLREQVARRFDAAFDSLAEVRRQPRPTDLAQERHALHLYTLVLDPERLRVDRDRVVCALRAENIGVGIHYRPVHLEPFYQRLGGRPAAVPVSEQIGANILTLPLTPEFTDADTTDVITAVHKVLDAYRR